MAEALDSHRGSAYQACSWRITYVYCQGPGPGPQGLGGWGGGGGSRWRYSEESTKRDQRKLEQQLRTQSGLPNCLLDSSRRQPGVRCSGSLTSQQPLVFCAPEPVEDLIWSVSMGNAQGCETHLNFTEIFFFWKEEKIHQLYGKTLFHSYKYSLQCCASVRKYIPFGHAIIIY